jgi:hypothetical protein
MIDHARDCGSRETDSHVLWESSRTFDKISNGGNNTLARMQLEQHDESVGVSSGINCKCDR